MLIVWYCLGRRSSSSFNCMPGSCCQGDCSCLKVKHISQLRAQTINTKQKQKSNCKTISNSNPSASFLADIGVSTHVKWYKLTLKRHYRPKTMRLGWRLGIRYTVTLWISWEPGQAVPFFSNMTFPNDVQSATSLKKKGNAWAESCGNGIWATQLMFMEREMWK